MEREGEGGRQRGFFVSFGYTKDAEDESGRSSSGPSGSSSC
jgi:hypothetical protein